MDDRLQLRGAKSDKNAKNARFAVGSDAKSDKNGKNARFDGAPDVKTPAIIERCKSLGLVDDFNRPGGPVFYAKKLVAMLCFGVLLGLLVRYVNGCTTFWCGALTAYALWCVVNWFDAFVMDCLWFCHDEHFIIPGTEDMAADYHDYWFHIKGGFMGMALAIPAALMAGVIVIL